MDQETLLEKIEDKKEGTIHLVGEGKKINRPEDGYQPNFEATIKYLLNGSKIAEEISLAENHGELNLEIEKNLEWLKGILTEKNYKCQINRDGLYFKRLARK